ncbi:MULTISPECIES: glycosyltransferase family 1 protein [Halomonadaceae]|uniref:glycosyltransferase family 4 protein n=1 Tax=Halomonadaceae TaxID=28256 RepID=UPI001598D66D|nr:MULTISPECIES: glycosyltransferase family 1 protein [Halomonas]QJQ96700.1 glycosyltransferase family 1 protein [Halomonas sp. PA5]
MRLCLVSETWSPDINGVAHTLGHLSRELRHRQVELLLVRPRPENDTKAPGVDAELQVRGFHLPRYSAVQFGYPSTSALITFCHEQRPDVIYIATEGPLGWSALKVAKQLSIPVVSGFHTNFDHYMGDYGLGWLKGPVRRALRHFHNRTHATLVPTLAQSEAMAKQGFDNVQVMGRGIDGDHFTPAKREQALRKSWGASEHQPVVLHVGRLAKEKNLDLLVDTLLVMHLARPDMVSVVVGDGPLRASLQRRLPNTHFTGFIDNDTLARHYASADMFLFPSCSETYGNVVAEAMASGLGVVAFKHAAAAELIESNRHGITVPLGDDAAFIVSAVTLCQSPAQYGQLGRSARLRATSRRWEKVADGFLDVLNAAQESQHESVTNACRL